MWQVYSPSPLASQRVADLVEIANKIRQLQNIEEPFERQRDRNTCHDHISFGKMLVKRCGQMEEEEGVKGLNTNSRRHKTSIQDKILVPANFFDIAVLSTRKRL